MWLLISSSLSAQNAFEKFKGFPEVHTEADIRKFMNQQSEYQRTHFYIEATLKVEPLWLSYDSLLFLATAFDVNLGMGHTPKDVVFDPMDAFFGFTPFVEARFEPFYARFGLDHRCFHEIDQKELPTVYWNMMFLSAHTENARLTDFAQRVLIDSSMGWKERIAMGVKGGYFMKKFFGLVRESSVDYENDRRAEFEVMARVLALRVKRWAFTSEAHTKWGSYRQPDKEESKLYWRQTLCIQAIHRSPIGKIMYLFVRGSLDDMPLHHDQPRFTRSKLIELGIGVGL